MTICYLGQKQALSRTPKPTPSTTSIEHPIASSWMKFMHLRFAASSQPKSSLFLVRGRAIHTYINQRPSGKTAPIFCPTVTQQALPRIHITKNEEPPRFLAASVSFAQNLRTVVAAKAVVALSSSGQEDFPWC